MVCPYCSTDMTPIELNGKTFCSNCGLTIANNSPEPTINTINPVPETVSNVATNAPEEVEFPVIPEIVENNQQSMIDSGQIDYSSSEVEKPTNTEPLVDYFGQFESNKTDNEGVKLNVVTEEPIPLPSKPITEEAAKDLGITSKEPVLESKISDLSIPSEEDFTETTTDYEPVSSYVELANPGDEKETLEASGILLDILGEESNKQSTISNQPLTELEAGSQKLETILDPIAEPEIPAETETKEEDDIYTLPREVKVGLRNKKVNKKQSIINNKSKADDSKPEEVDPKTERKIEKLEELIADTPEPEVSLTPEEAMSYDPDTIDTDDISPANAKSEIIKDYFSTAIEKDKKTKKVKSKKKKQKQSFKIMRLTLILICAFAILSVGSYFAYDYLKTPNNEIQSKGNIGFTTITPIYIPEGYIFKDNNYSESDKTYQANYIFANDKLKIITYKQIQVDDSVKYISDYLLAKNASFVEKTVGEVAITEMNKNNLIWAKDGFVFIIETENYDLSNELLYKMAETVK